MKAKEIVLLIFIIIVGVFFYHAKTGKIYVDWNLDEFIGLDLEESTSQESQVIEPPFPPAFKVTNAHGDVEIQGTESDKITITLLKTAWRKNAEKAKEILDNLHLVIARDDQAVALTTNRDQLESRRRYFGVNRGFETTFRISVPLNMSVEVTNSHGLVRVAKVGKTTVRNPHGEIVAAEVTGELQIENSYEDVKLSGLSSACQIKSGHSSIFVDTVQGDLRIDTSYGTVQLKKAAQKVVVDGSHAEVIGEDLSGPLDIRNSYEKISLLRVGPTKIEGQHSEIEADDVSGGLEIRDNYESVNLNNIRGNLNISGNNLSILGKNVVGEEIYISSSYENIELVDFSGKTKVLQSHGDVILDPLPLTASIEVQGEYAPITLYWPAGEQYPLEAQTKNSEIQWRLPGEITVEEKDSLSVARAFLDLKEKPRIMLTTTYGDILFEPGSPPPSK
jgi:hypothetical protein